MAERNYWVLCDDNCRFPAMTKEQIIAAIAEATGKTPTDVDDAFITKIREMNASANLKFWVGTTAQFNALEEKDDNTLYILSDDDTAEGWDEIAERVTKAEQNISGMVAGSIKVGKTDMIDTEIVPLYSDISSEEITKCGLYAITVQKGEGGGTLTSMNNFSTVMMSIPLISRYTWYKAPTIYDGVEVYLNYSMGIPTNYQQNFYLNIPSESEATYKIKEIRLITEY